MFTFDARTIVSGIIDASLKRASRNDTPAVYFSCPKSEPNLKSAFVFAVDEGFKRDKQSASPAEATAISAQY